MTQLETIVAPATPGGESALAVVRISGPRAVEIACAQRAGRPPLPRQVWHGDFKAIDGSTIDDVVFCFFGGPRSYTGDDVLEISSHGNPYITRRLLEDCVARGCRVAEAGEFTRRAFLNGRLDLTEAEAVMDVIRARSDRALEAARLQLRGALGRRIDRMVDDVLQCCAAIEAYIDFPEDDLPGEDRASRIQELERVRDEVDRLRLTRRQGDLLREGLRVVLIGEPNAGKSSLLNRLAGYDRAIVSAEPGTTRDFLEEPVLLGPHRIRVIDTAGLRETGGAIEREGVTRTLEKVEEADLVVLVVDATRPCPTLPATVGDRLTCGRTVIAVNKADLPAREFRWSGADELPAIEVSAVTGLGLDRLLKTLILLADGLTGAGADEEHIAVNARHGAALGEASEGLGRALGILIAEGPLELVGSELRAAVGALGVIVGRIDHERVLDRVFASFCIGK